jgi:hypothetical protein
MNEARIGDYKNNFSVFAAAISDAATKLAELG